MKNKLYLLKVAPIFAVFVLSLSACGGKAQGEDVLSSMPDSPTQVEETTPVDDDKDYVSQKSIADMANSSNIDISTLPKKEKEEKKTGLQIGPVNSPFEKNDSSIGNGEETNGEGGETVLENGEGSLGETPDNIDGVVETPTPTPTETPDSTSSNSNVANTTSNAN